MCIYGTLQLYQRSGDRPAADEGIDTMLDHDVEAYEEPGLDTISDRGASVLRGDEARAALAAHLHPDFGRDGLVDVQVSVSEVYERKGYFSAHGIGSKPGSGDYPFHGRIVRIEAFVPDRKKFNPSLESLAESVYADEAKKQEAAKQARIAELRAAKDALDKELSALEG